MKELIISSLHYLNYLKILKPYSHFTPYSSPFFFYFLGYIGEFEFIDDHRGGKVVIELLGRINKCGVISPRYDVKFVDIEKWVTNLLPSRQFGSLIVTTSYGIMDHEEARHRGLGGKILGYFY